MLKSLIRTSGMLLIAGSLTVWMVSQVAATQVPNRPEYVPGEILVKFKAGISRSARDAAVLQVKGKVLRTFRRIPLLHLKVGTPTVQGALNELNRLPEVVYAEPNDVRYLDATPNDASFSDMWGLNNTGQTGGTPDADIDAPEAWDLWTGTSDMAVAVLDSGADLNHEDLSGNIWVNAGEIPGNGIDDDGNGYVDDVHGWDFAWNDNDPSDTDSICGGHGTHTAGTIGAVGDNGIGVTGVNWRVKVMPLKIFKKYLLVFCSTTSADIVEAVEYAAMMGVRVSSNSYGGGPFSQAEFDAIRASGSLFVAAAGNEGADNDLIPSYPASYNLDNVVSVAATDDRDQLASFSNYGLASVDLAAPGVDILSTTPNDTYSFFSGTSMATPHVAGAVALLMGYDPLLTNNEVKWMILQGTDDKTLPVLSGGRLNVYNALTLPSPQVAIQITPNGPTTVSPGETISYHARLTNQEPTDKMVQASVVVVDPLGREVLLAARVLSIPAGGVLSQDLSVHVPAGVAPGDYQLAGRIEIPSVSYDEDVVVYTIVP